MKKILLIILVLFLVFMIYYFNLDRKVYVLSIGDYIVNNNSDDLIKDNLGKKYENDVIYSNDGDYRIIDLINDINDNREFNYNNKEYTLDNVLIKADLIFISIGLNDLRYNKINNYDYVDEVLTDLDEVLKLIRKYSKEKVYVFNYLIDNKELCDYVNRRLYKIVERYDMDVIDISSIELSSNDNNISNKIKNVLKNFTNLKK